MPVAMVSFIDQTRKWYKAVLGVPSTQMKREIAVCNHTIVDDAEITIVNNTLEDERFSDSSITTGATPIIFYAGVKLTNPEGLVLGTLCVVDHKPNSITEKQAEMLVCIANQVMSLLESRRTNLILHQIKIEQNSLLKGLNEFTTVLAYDISAPLARLKSLADLLLKDIDKKNSIELYSKFIGQNVKHLLRLVNDLIQYYKSDQFYLEPKEKIELTPFLNEIRTICDLDKAINFQMPIENKKTIVVRRVVLYHILINLISNSIRHNSKKDRKICVEFSELKDHYQFTIRDNGNGIPKNKIDKVFDALTTLNKETDGSGLGLATVDKLVNKEGGAISVESEEVLGSTFQFSIAK